MQTNRQSHSIRVFTKIAMVLDYITECKDTLSVSTMAKELDMPRATLYRILDALEKEDILIRSDPSGYRLGNRLIYWAVDTLNHYDLRDLVRPYIERLSDETGLSCSFYIRVQSSRVCLDRVDGRTDNRPYVKVGQHLPLHVGAPGHVLVAWLPETERIRVLEQSDLHYPGFPLGSVEVDWAHIRERRWAFSSAEHFRNISSLSAPVLVSDNQPVCAISLSGPLDALNPQNYPSFIPLLTGISVEISDFVSKVPGLYTQETVRGGI